MTAARYAMPEKPDPAIWTHPALARAIAERDVGALFCLLHYQFDVSQSDLARLTQCTNAEMWEFIHKGRRTQSYALLARIADGLGIPRGQMGLAYTATDAPASALPTPRRPRRALETPQQRHQFVATLAPFAVGGTPTDVEAYLPQLPDSPLPAPAAVTAATVHTVGAITAEHRRLDATFGGGSCRDSAVSNLIWARSLLRSDCPDDSLQTALLRGLADLHNLVGWMCHDLGDQGSARRFLAQGLVYAQDAGDSSLMADAFYRLGRVSIHQEDPTEALHLFQLGLILAQNSSSLHSAAILHANIAWAHAKLGHDQPVRESLARAVDELGRAAETPAPEWTAFFGNADLDGMRGLIFAALARHEQHRTTYAPRAIEHATRALQHRGGRPSRSAMFDHLTIATGYTLLGQNSDAAGHARQVLEATEDVRSRRLHDRLCTLADVAAPVTATDSELGDVVHDIRASSWT